MTTSYKEQWKNLWYPLKDKCKDVFGVELINSSQIITFLKKNDITTDKINTKLTIIRSNNITTGDNNHLLLLNLLTKIVNNYSKNKPK